MSPAAAECSVLHEVGRQYLQYCRISDYRYPSPHWLLSRSRLLSADLILNISTLHVTRCVTQLVTRDTAVTHRLQVCKLALQISKRSSVLQLSRLITSWLGGNKTVFATLWWFWKIAWQQQKLKIFGENMKLCILISVGVQIIINRGHTACLVPGN